MADLLLQHPVGRIKPQEVRRYYSSFGYRAGSWNKPRRVVAKVEWHPGDGKPQNGGGGGGDQTIDPIIRGLLARLPKSGDVWPEAERKLWLDLLAGSFKLIYKDATDLGRDCRAAMVDGRR